MKYLPIDRQLFIENRKSFAEKIDKNFLVWVKMLIKTDAFVYKIDEMQYEL